MRRYMRWIKHPWTFRLADLVRAAHLHHLQVRSHLGGSGQQVQLDVRVGQTVEVHGLQTLKHKSQSDVRPVTTIKPQNGAEESIQAEDERQELWDHKEVHEETFDELTAAHQTHWGVGSSQPEEMISRFSGGISVCLVLYFTKVCFHSIELKNFVKKNIEKKLEQFLNINFKSWFKDVQFLE